MSEPNVRLSGPTLKVLKLLLDSPRIERSGAEPSKGRRSTLALFDRARFDVHPVSEGLVQPWTRKGFVWRRPWGRALRLRSNRLRRFAHSGLDS